MYLKELELISQRDTYTPLFIATLFTVANVKQSKCPSMENEEKWGIYIRYYFSFKKGNFDLCNNMDRPGGRCAKLARHRKTNAA